MICFISENYPVSGNFTAGLYVEDLTDMSHQLGHHAGTTTMADHAEVDIVPPADEVVVEVDFGPSTYLVDVLRTDGRIVHLRPCHPN